MDSPNELKLLLPVMREKNKQIFDFPIRSHQKYFLLRPTITRKFWEVFLAGCGYNYHKYADLYKNILTLCTWRNDLHSVELVYVFPRTQAVSLVLPKICTMNEQGSLTLGLGFVSNAKLNMYR